MKNDVNTIYVTASNSRHRRVSAEIERRVPGYTVTTSSDLAS